MECDHTVDQLVRAGAIELPSGQLELDIGKCFFRSGLLKSASSDGDGTISTSGKFGEASISVKFRAVGDLASLSHSEVSVFGQSGEVMIPSGPAERAEVFDTIAGKISSMVKSREVKPVIEDRREEVIAETADKLVSLMGDVLGSMDAGEILALGSREIYRALERATQREKNE